MNANATLAAIAIKIVMVNAVVKRGEKVFNAYMISSIRFNCWLLLLLARLGSARLFSFCSSVVNRNEWGASPHHVIPALYAHKTKVSSFFLNFFFVGCGCLGVGPWVWARGCGRSGVGAWVGRWGRRDGNGRARDEAGWIGIVAVGWARIASLGLPNPDSDWRLGCDR